MGLGYNLEDIRSIIAQQQNRPGALLPILHAIQDLLGYIPSDSVEQIAAALNLSRAEVHGVITFYHYFRLSPPARHMIQICRAEACQSMGSEQLARHAEDSLSGKKPGEFSVLSVYCLGLCATSPAIMINEMLYSRVTPEKFDRLIRKVENLT